MPNYYRLGQKHAQQYLGLPHQDRSYLKDFIAGVDPTGTYTSEYGIADSNTDANAKARMATGVAGGVLGGAAVIPATIMGLMRAKKGLPGGIAGVAREFGKGFMDPGKQLVNTIGVRRTLKNAPTHGINEKQMAQIKEFMGDMTGMTDTPPSWKKSLMGKLAPKSISPAQAKLLPPQMMQDASDFMGKKLRGAATGMGAAGAFAGGSAALQYNKGRNQGEQMDPATKQRVLQNA